MSFPTDRPRRLRRTEGLRRLVRENRLSADDLVQPLFIVPGTGVRAEIPSMPGQHHLSVDLAAEEGARLFEAGVPGVLLFGVPDPRAKDELGTEAANPDGEVQRAVRALKRAAPDLVVITDVCLCEYTCHGHCGALDAHRGVDNDLTLDLLSRAANSHAAAGADVIAPSDMMDGRVGAIRVALDRAGFADRAILSYAVKHASAFYGPFRDAAGSAPQFGDRRAYQMDSANADEAMREVALDLEEGADMVMVKPGLPCLDLLARVKETFRRPTAAYQVSGEYAMVEAAAARGFIDRRRVILESLLAFKRAGADFVMTYWAGEVAAWLRETR